VLSSICITVADVKKKRRKWYLALAFLVELAIGKRCIRFIRIFLMHIEVVNVGEIENSLFVLDQPGQYVYFFYAATETKKTLTINMIHPDIILVCRAILV
jgi:hypothetical protein